MATMQRSVVFTVKQMLWLEKRAKELGISIAEVVRRIVDDSRRENAQ